MCQQGGEVSTLTMSQGDTRGEIFRKGDTRGEIFRKGEETSNST